MCLRIEGVEKEDVRVAYSLKCRWDYGHFCGHVCCSLLLSRVKYLQIGTSFAVLYSCICEDLIKQLRVPADNRSLEGMYKSSWRLDEFRVPVLHMKRGGCSGPGCREGWRKPWLRNGVSSESQSCQPHADTWANESTIWLPTSEKKLLRFWKLYLPNFQCQCLLVSSILFWQLFGNVVALKV